MQDIVSLSNYVKTNLREQLATVPGVGEVKVFGTSPTLDDVNVKQNPGIALMLAPTVDAKPSEIAVALQQRLAELRAELPAGLLLTMPINSASMDDPRESLLLLEVPLPQGTDASQRNIQLSGVSARLRELPGIKNWVGFTRHPLDSGNHYLCVVLHAAANEPDQAQKKLRAAIQKLFASKDSPQVRIKNFAKPDATVIRAAVSGPDVMVADELAAKLVKQLIASRRYTAEQFRSPQTVVPRITVKLDRSKLALLGITQTEVAASLGETLSMPLQADQSRETIALPDNGKLNTVGGLASVRLKNAAGQEFALSEVASIESNLSKSVVYRVNDQAAVLLAIQTLGQQDQQSAREQIDSLFAAARGMAKPGDEYKLVWLEE